MINKRKSVFSTADLVFFAFAAIAAVIGPIIFTGYTFNVVNVALIYVLCVYGASVLTGMGGIMAFTYITFMGLGAYWAANLSTGRWGGVTMSSIPILLTAPIVVGLIGAGLGAVLFRMKGSFFVFGTLALVNVAHVFFSNYVPVFGGASGIKHIPTLTVGEFKFDSNRKWFYLLIFTAVIGYIIVERIRNTKLGRSLASIKDNETTALSLGVNIQQTKIIAFGIAAAFSGFAGALYAMQSRYISSDLFTFSQSTLIIIMLVMGGMNNTSGAVIGAVLVQALPEIFRSLKSFLNLAYGLGIILLIIFMPSGLASLGDKAIALAKKKLTEIKNKKRGAAANETDIDNKSCE